MVSLSEKIKIVRDYNERYDFADRRQADRWFIDCDDWTGDSAWSLKQDFDRLVSMNDEVEYYEGIQFRFLEELNVTCLFGRAESWLPKILDSLRIPMTFWMQDNALVLEQILRRPYPHLIFIDTTSEEMAHYIDVTLEDYMRSGYPESSFEYVDGVVRIAPVLPDE